LTVVKAVVARVVQRDPAFAVAAAGSLADVQALIEAARKQTARAVSSGLVGLYWHHSTRIQRNILKEKRGCTAHGLSPHLRGN
jgi:hypothetical protein